MKKILMERSYIANYSSSLLTFKWDGLVLFHQHDNNDEVVCGDGFDQLWQWRWRWLRIFWSLCDSLFVGRQFLQLLHKIIVLFTLRLLFLPYYVLNSPSSFHPHIFLVPVAIFIQINFIYQFHTLKNQTLSKVSNDALIAGGQKVLTSNLKQ